jgi:pimeloyl-ACP methyl ester carboxylesterase
LAAAGSGTLCHSQSRLKRTGVLSRGEYRRWLAQDRQALLALANDKGTFSMANRYVVFSHGKDGGPWGRKITTLADVARTEGYEVESVDYRGIDTVRGRIDSLLAVCKSLSGDLVLVGSSLGGFVSVAAASPLHARGVFLMAPALYMEGLPPLRERVLDCPATIVHGWGDQVVPPEHSVRFAREYSAPLHLLPSDHQLHDQLLCIKYLFEYFLIGLDLPLATT